MNHFLDMLAFSFSVTGPICVVLALGVILRRQGMINDDFVDIGSKLVFNITLPSLLFISIIKTDLGKTTNLPLIGVGLVGTLLAFLLLELVAKHWVHPVSERGIVVQGGFRSNMGIIGLAYCFNAYGNEGLVAASLYMALMTVLFNVLSVVTLNRSLQHEAGLKGTLLGIARNPLILGILLAFPVAWSGLNVPQVLIRTGEYFADMTLPLALLCAGASLNFGALRHNMSHAMIAALFKLGIVPLLITLGGIWIGFRGMELGVLLLMASAPTAAASYVMVRSMGGNGALAANIIVITTVGSLLTTSVSVTLLQGLELL